MMKREFTFSDGKSDKFWNIDVQGDSFTVTYGRTGTSGQTQIKSFESDVEAQTAADKLIAEKVKKGYSELASSKSTSDASPETFVTSSSSAPAASTPTSKAAASSKATPKVSKKAEPEESGENGKTTEEPGTIVDWNINAERLVRLEPNDWLWATWRHRVAQQRPSGAERVFDIEKSVQKLREVPTDQYWSGLRWSKADITANISRPEAHFWLVAMTSKRGNRHQSSGSNQYSFKADFDQNVATPLQSREFSGNVSIEEAATLIEDCERNYHSANPALILVLTRLFNSLELLEVLLHDKSTHHPYNDVELLKSFCEGFRIYVLPYLSHEEIEAMRERLRPLIDAKHWPTDYYHPPRLPFHLGAQLGMHEELQAVVKSWPDDHYFGGKDWHDHYHRPQEIIFGLGNADAVSHHMRRLGLRFQSTDHVRAWLAHTECSQPDWVVHSVLNSVGNSYIAAAKDVAEKLTKVFALAEAPEIAPAMLQLMLESKAPRAAREWLEMHAGHTIRGLAPLAVGRGKFADSAVEILRSFKKRGAETALSEATQELPTEAQGRFQELILDYTEKEYEPFGDQDAPETVRAALGGDPKLRKTKTTWIPASDLPPITHGARRLSDAQIEALLAALRHPKHALTQAVKATADKASLDAFAWQLFQRWLREGAASKEKWAMLALGELGGDVCALKLMPLIRAWPGESQHQRAVTGLECLRAIGTDTALMQINGIAQKVKFKGLQAKAVEAMEGIAADRGLSRAQLEDRVVPTCDLDERGKRVFDFGPRQFELILGSDMKPMVREQGVKLAKPRPNLPAPNSKDDAEKAQAALDEWKLLKKQVSDVAKIQAVRLEQAMVKGRRWTLDEFEILLAHHPLMTNIARLLVWEVAAGNCRATFRITEDGTYADADDETFDLHAGDWAHVGIIHPLNMFQDEAKVWGEIFSDYEIVPPFPQLGRPTYSLEGDEATQKEITRFKDTKVQPQTLCFGLEKFDWERGPALDGGGFYEHYKFFETSDVTACVEYDPGLGMGGQEWWEPQQVTRIYFVPTKRSTQGNNYWGYPDQKDAPPLQEIDPVAISEVLKDVTELVAKGEIK